MIVVKAMIKGRSPIIAGSDAGGGTGIQAEPFLSPTDKPLFKKQNRSFWLLLLFSVLVLLIVAPFAFAAEKPSIPKEYWGTWVGQWDDTPFSKEDIRYFCGEIDDAKIVNIDAKGITGYDVYFALRKLSKEHDALKMVFEASGEGETSTETIFFQKTDQNSFLWIQKYSDYTQKFPLFRCKSYD